MATKVDWRGASIATAMRVEQMVENQVELFFEVAFAVV